MRISDWSSDVCSSDLLDLTRPIGTFTGRKLAGLTHDAPRCQALLDDVGVAYSVLPPVHEGRCGYSDAVRISSDGLLGVGWHPPSPGLDRKSTRLNSSH